MAELHPDREQVAPFAGAWIQTSNCFAYSARWTVAPFAGAWILSFELYLDVLERRLFLARLSGESLQYIPHRRMVPFAAARRGHLTLVQLGRDFRQ